MNSLLQLLLLSLLSTKCAVRADDVGPNFNPEDGETWEMDYGYYPFKSFQTTDVVAPAFRKVIDSPECYDGLYTFLTPRGYSLQAQGPMIADNHGEMVWSKYVDGMPYDLVMHELDGEQFLTYWVGDDSVRGHGAGEYYVLNSSYHQVAKISAVGDDLKADLHEMVITPEGTALLTVYQVYPHDLTEFRGFPEDEPDPNYIWDCLFQEIDLATNKLLFQWRASDHHAINETFIPIDDNGSKGSPWDWYHMNSIQKDELGNYLISARYTHTITYIDGKTGDVIWILGGKRNMFEDQSNGRATKFANQHNARILPLNTFPNMLKDELREEGFWEGEKSRDGRTTQLLTMFDNSAEAAHYSDDMSHGLLLEISYPSPARTPEAKVNDLSNTGDLSKRDIGHAVRLIRSYNHPQGIISSSQGSMQVVPGRQRGQDPKVLVGYGFNAVWTEYSSEGKVLCDTHFATKYSWERGDVQSYRAFKFPWVGRPYYPPAAALGDDAVFASWNGATEVNKWVLQQSTHFESEMEKSWTDITTVNRTGFETEIKFVEDDAKRYLRVVALDVNDNVLGLSRSIDLGWTVGLTSAVPQGPLTSGLTPLKMLMLFAFNVTALFLLVEGYKQFTTWRRGQYSREYKSVRLGSDA